MGVRAWFDRLLGTSSALFGVAMVAPGIVVFASQLIVYTVGWKPDWIPYLLAFMGLAGSLQIWSGFNMIRWAGRWG